MGAAEKALSKKNNTHVHMETFPETITRRSIALLGHIVRLTTDGPMAQQTSLRKHNPLFPAAKRVGRHKLNWAKETYTSAWGKAKANGPSTFGDTIEATEEQYIYLISRAEMRLPPFGSQN